MCICFSIHDYGIGAIQRRRVQLEMSEMQPKDERRKGGGMVNEWFGRRGQCQKYRKYKNKKETE